MNGYKNFNDINAVAHGQNDKTYVYGENDSFILLNDLSVERRAEGQFYRVWYSERVTAINMDNSKNLLFHTGSQGNDLYTIDPHYGTATDTIGSYFHEWADFKNIAISNTSPTSSVSLPGKTDGASWQVDENRKIWSHGDSKVTLTGSIDVTFRGVPFEAALPEEALPAETVMTTVPSWSYVSSQTASDWVIVPDLDLISPSFGVDETVTTPVAVAAMESTLPNTTMLSSTVLLLDTDLLCAWLAEQQRQSLRKNADDIYEDINWLNDFDEIALLELRKR